MREQLSLEWVRRREKEWQGKLMNAEAVDEGETTVVMKSTQKTNDQSQWWTIETVKCGEDACNAEEQQWKGES